MGRWLEELMLVRGREVSLAAVGAVVVVAAVVLAALLLPGCGSAAQSHRRLNLLTDIADPTYVHLVCDSIVEGFEMLRGSQLTARAALEAGLEGAAATAIAEGLAAWARLQGLVPRLLGMRTAGGES